MFSLYAPQVGKPTSEKQTFWEKVEEEVDKVPPGGGLIFGGDVNPHAGMKIIGYEDVLGLYGYGDRNAEGVMVLDTCKIHDLRILNSLFRKREVDNL